MRIAFVLPGYPYHPIGGYRIVYQYANYLARNGHDVTVAHAVMPWPRPETPFPKYLRHGWRRVLRSFPPKVTWQELADRIKVVYMPGDLDQRKLPEADFVFATAWNTAAPVCALPSSKGIGCYLIQHWEAIFPSVSEREVECTWRLPLHKVVISRWLFEKGVNIGVNADDLVHIPNAIDHERFQVLAPPESRPVSVVALNHTAPWKGTADAIVAMKMLHESHPEVSCALFGTVPRPAMLPTWIRYFHNPTQDVLTREVYNGHAIYIGASWTEGWSLPPAEAMACGCAFVGTDSGGLRDYAIHEKTALLSEPRSPEALYENVVRLVEHPAEMHRIQRDGTAFIKKFTWDRSGRALESWLHSILRQKEISN